MILSYLRIQLFLFFLFSYRFIWIILRQKPLDDFDLILREICDYFIAVILKRQNDFKQLQEPLLSANHTDVIR